MQSLFGTVGIAILVMASTSAAGNTAKVHYVANEGFLIEVGAKRLLHVGDTVLSQNPELFNDGVFETVDADIAFLAQRLELIFANPVIFDTPRQTREF